MNMARKLGTARMSADEFRAVSATIGDLLTRLREVNAAINGRVPARITDIYLRADRSLHRFKLVLADQEADLRYVRNPD
jgi:hypothetical protein